MSRKDHQHTLRDADLPEAAEGLTIILTNALEEETQQGARWLNWADQALGKTKPPKTKKRAAAF